MLHMKESYRVSSLTASHILSLDDAVVFPPNDNGGLGEFLAYVRRVARTCEGH